MKNVSDKNCRENQNTHFMFSNSPTSPPKYLAIYEIICKNVLKPERPQLIIWPMRIA
jgi:hypothetical protein